MLPVLSGAIGKAERQFAAKAQALLALHERVEAMALDELDRVPDPVVRTLE